MKKFSIFLLAIFSMLVLVGCKSAEGLTRNEQKNIVKLENFDAHRRKVEFELKIDDVNEKIKNRTIIAKLFEENNKLKTSAELKRSVEVNFDLKGGTSSAVIEAQDVKIGAKATKPKTEPKLEGYKFDGWYLDGKLYDFNSKPSHNITLVAGYINLDDDSKTNVTIEPGERDGMEFTSHTFSNLEGGSTYRLEISVSLVVKGQVENYILINKEFTTLDIGLTEEDPVLITTEEEFLNIGKVDDGKVYYRLENDLDFSSYDEDSYYKHLFERRKFQGEFDGNNKTIKNFVIESEQSNLYLSGITSGAPANVGLFPENAGLIKDLTIENGYIELTKRSIFPKEVNIGLLVGQNNGEIENIKVVNSLIKTNFVFTGDIHVGGLVGKSESKSSIKDADVTVELDLTSTSRTEFYVGGIVGYVTDATVQDSVVEVKMGIKNADSSNIGGAIGYLYDSKAERIAVSSEIEVTTNVTNISSKEVINGAIGGAIGQQNDAEVDELYVESIITVERSVNKAKTQSNVDRLYVAGAIGKDISSRTKNVLVQTLINVGDKDDDKAFEGFELVYIAGVVGQSYLSTHEDVLAVYPHITVTTNPGAVYFVSPTSGTEALETNVRYVESLLIVDNQVYTVEGLKISYEEVEVVEPSEPEVPETEIEGTEPVDPTEPEPTEVESGFDKVVVTTDLNTKAAIFEGFFDEDSFVMEHFENSEFEGNFL